MPEDDRSMLYKLEPLIERWPAVSQPEGHVHFRKKMLWTTGTLVTYFILTNVLLYGLGQQSIDLFAQFRAVLAGASGSIVHLGIGPIVTGSIIMQLFSGANIFKLDKQDPDDKAIYQGTQKILVVLMIFVTGAPQVFGFLTPSPVFVDQFGLNGARALLIFQLALGGYLVFLMDEVISKWGIGSGISLFIAAGVSQSLFTGMFSWIPNTPGSAMSIRNPPGGLLPKTAYLVNEMSTAQLVRQGGFEQIFLQQPNPVSALITTVIIFVAVVYAESTRIELPLSHGRVRGARGRYPIKLMYANVMPVIFVSALIANVNLVSILLWNNPNIPLLGHNPAVGSYLPGQTTAVSGFAYYFSRVQGIQSWLLPLIGIQGGSQVLTYREPWQVILHVAAYTATMIVGSIIFAIFWVETADMGADSVAEQIESSGMQIPGFRRDPRIIQKVLERYIPTVTIISGAAVGLLAAFASVMGTVGQVGGTGLLLTIGILQRTYEQIAQEQMMEMHPMLRGFFGEA
jgi:preprotein translocase subunit SecY